MSPAEQTIGPTDRRVLRDLAHRVAEIAADPVMDQRRRLWTRHASLESERPMILAETGGVLNELIPESEYLCTGDAARGLERGFRNTIFRHEQVNDDGVTTATINCNWHVSIGDYGVLPQRHTTEGEKKTSYRWDPPIKDLDREFDRLHPRELSVDREATMRRREQLEELFGDILRVRLRGAFWWTLGMTWPAVDLIGLDGLMLQMCDNPAGVHRLMAFLRDDHLHLVEWCESEGLLTLNNEDDYCGSGSIGYTDELPQPDRRDGDPVRAKDLWMLSESQETVGISPRMFAEFIFPYQLPIIERFGLCYYGCCEPVHSRWDSLRKIPNLRRVSVSPWCDEQVMAEALAGRGIFCRKPNPSLISTEAWDEELIRRDLRSTVETARDCALEIVMKDVHTVADQPWRLGRWVEIARGEAQRHNA